MSFVLTICCEYRISLSDFVQLDKERYELAEMLRLMVDKRFPYVVQNKTGKNRFLVKCAICHALHFP